MKLSWKNLTEIIDLDGLSPKQVSDILTSRGIEIEGITPLGQGLEKVVSAHLLERAPHPQADRLSVCKVSLGNGKSELQIVCGAQNMKAGDRVVLAQVGANLPNGLKIEASKIRGVESFGMLCSEEELGLKDEADGLLILPVTTEPGQPIAKVLGRDDTLLEIKLTPNRADCLSYYGIARELVSATGRKLKIPELKQLEWTEFEGTAKSGSGDSELATSCEADGLGCQFLGVKMEGVRVGPSPSWLVQRLEAIGSRSINNIVDVTNWVMFELGHPLHAYDFDKLSSKKLAIRVAQPNEKLSLLDGTQIELAGWELVIADSKGPVSLAGVMGGSESEVSETTQNLFLECAQFDPTLIRKAAKVYQKATEASHRFERGVDALGLMRAMCRMVHLIETIAGGKVTGTVRSFHGATFNKLSKPKAISLKPEFIRDFLGVQTSDREIRSIFEKLECQVSGDSTWSVTPPSYRLDLSSPEDLSEEVARSIGYDAIPNTLPPLTQTPRVSAEHQAFQIQNRAKRVLVELGFFENVQYGFTSKKWLEEFGIQGTVRVQNPLSEEQEMMVPSLVPGLVQVALSNWNHHFGSESPNIRLFELRPTFHSEGVQAKSESDTGVRETWKLSFLMTGKRAVSDIASDSVASEIDFRDLRGTIEGFLRRMGTRGFRITAGFQNTQNSQNSWFHPGQSATLWVGKDPIGTFGRLHPKLEKKLKCRAPIFLTELDWAPIQKLSGNTTQFKKWAEFPGIERDFALLVPKTLAAEKVTASALKAAKPFAKLVKVFDTYEGPQVPAGQMSLAIRILFSVDDRNMTEAEAEGVSQKVLAQWKSELGIGLR